MNDETEEKKAQIRGDIRCLLVRAPGSAGGRDSEIPDIGRLFRVIRLGGDFTAAIGCPTYIGSIYLY